MEKLRVEINDCGDKRYYKWDTDEYHNPYGPAIERANGTKCWYVNDKRHREDGPAIEFANGHKEWYLNGVELTEKEFNNRHSCAGKVVEIDGKRYKLEEV